MTIDRGSNSLRISFVGDNRNLSLLFFLVEPWMVDDAVYTLHTLHNDQ